jgi:hypothetical protein
MQDEIKILSKDQVANKLWELGIFMDTDTLTAFAQKWGIEAIFENEQGEEFFCQKSAELICKNLLNLQAKAPQSEDEPAPVLDIIKWQAWNDVSEELRERGE